MGCLEVYATPLGSQKQHLLRWQRLSERNWLELSGLVLQEVKHGEIELKNLRKASTSGIFNEVVIKGKAEKFPKLKDFNLRSQKSSTLPLHLGHWKSLAFRICPRRVLATDPEDVWAMWGSKSGLVGSLLQLLRLFLWRLASAKHCDIWQVLIMPNRQWLDEAALSRFQTSWPRDSLLHQAPRHLKCNLCSWNRPRDGYVSMFEGWNVETSVHQRLHRMGKNQRPIHKTVRCKDVQSHSCSGIVCTHDCQSIATKATNATKGGKVTKNETVENWLTKIEPVPPWKHWHLEYLPKEAQVQHPTPLTTHWYLLLWRTCNLKQMCPWQVGLQWSQTWCRQILPNQIQLFGFGKHFRNFQELSLYQVQVCHLRLKRNCCMIFQCLFRQPGVKTLVWNCFESRILTPTSLHRKSIGRIKHITLPIQLSTCSDLQLDLCTKGRKHQTTNEQEIVRTTKLQVCNVGPSLPTLVQLLSLLRCKELGRVQRMSKSVLAACWHSQNDCHTPCGPSCTSSLFTSLFGFDLRN